MTLLWVPVQRLTIEIVQVLLAYCRSSSTFVAWSFPPLLLEIYGQQILITYHRCLCLLIFKDLRIWKMEMMWTIILCQSFFGNSSLFILAMYSFTNISYPSAPIYITCGLEYTGDSKGQKFSGFFNKVQIKMYPDSGLSKKKMCTRNHSNHGICPLRLLRVQRRYV